jgi:hypothetical protein
MWRVEAKMRRTRAGAQFLVVLAAAGMLVFAVAPPALAAADSLAPAATKKPASTVAQALDPAAVLIPAGRGATSHRFAVPVPPGGRLLSTEARDASAGLTREVLVQDARGVVIGAFDAAWAQDAAGTPLRTSYRIDGAALVQTVRLPAGTVFPVTIDPTYTALAAEPVSAGVLAAAAFVTVPSNYVYDPRLGALHDYCTYAPDEFPAPLAPNADFRGPCARHDLCYAAGTSRSSCDTRLRVNMQTNCAYEYGILDPLRAACYSAAVVYWAAVVAVH